MSGGNGLDARLLRATKETARAEERYPAESPRLRAMRHTWRLVSADALAQVEQGQEDAAALVQEAEWAGMRLAEALRTAWTQAKARQ